MPRERSRTPADRREILVVGVALALIAVHVVADAFVALEPGTSRSGHLVAAGVALALLGLAGLAVARGRPGLRGAVELVLAPLALVGGGLAVAGARDGGPSGDEWTGLPLLLAGAALLATGIATLWRCRRREGRRFARRALLALTGVLAAYWVVLPLALAIVATHRPREGMTAPDLGRAVEDVTIRTSDGLVLRGSYAPSRNGAAVLAFPGRRSPRAHARMLAEEGYGVLLLDMRGQGASDGDPNAFGWRASRDVEAGLAYLRGRPDVDHGRIGGLGLSVGGEALIEAAARNRSLRAVVSDGAGERSVRESVLRGAAGIPSYPQAAILTAAVAVLSGDSPPPALQSLAGRIAPRSLLLVEAGRGAGGEELNRHYAAAGGTRTAHWRIAEATHTGGLAARPGEYRARVLAFFARALSPRR